MGPPRKTTAAGLAGEGGRDGGGGGQTADSQILLWMESKQSETLREFYVATKVWSYLIDFSFLFLLLNSGFSKCT